MLNDAIRIAKLIESVAVNYGAHVALTGGSLYKEGKRKDIDFIIYRIRQVEHIDIAGLFENLQSKGFGEIKGVGWCFKTAFDGISIDLLFPEEDGGEYVSGNKQL